MSNCQVHHVLGIERFICTIGTDTPGPHDDSDIDDGEEAEGDSDVIKRLKNHINALEAELLMKNAQVCVHITNYIN